VEDTLWGEYLRLNKASASEKSETSSHLYINFAFFNKFKSTFLHLARSHNSYLIHAAIGALFHMHPSQTHYKSCSFKSDE